MTMMLILYWINTPSWIFIDYSSNSSQVDMLLYFPCIIPTPSQSVFGFTPQCFLLSGEAANTYFLVFGSTEIGLTPGLPYLSEQLYTTKWFLFLDDTRLTCLR